MTDQAMPAWVIVVTRSSCEEVVENGLRRSGYRVYLPRYRKVLRPHGLARPAEASMRPLFPGLLFAQDWHGWPANRSIAGVVGLMPNGRGHAVLSDPDLALLMADERAGKFDDARTPGSGAVVRGDLCQGDQVEFERLGRRIAGTLERLSVKGRATVRDMLGRSYEVDASFLDLVSA